jgi:hypothetical protein
MGTTSQEKPNKLRDLRWRINEVTTVVEDIAKAVILCYVAYKLLTVGTSLLR